MVLADVTNLAASARGASAARGPEDEGPAKTLLRDKSGILAVAPKAIGGTRPNAPTQTPRPLRGQTVAVSRPASAPPRERPGSAQVNPRKNTTPRSARRPPAPPSLTPEEKTQWANSLWDQQQRCQAIRESISVCRERLKELRSRVSASNERAAREGDGPLKDAEEKSRLEKEKGLALCDYIEKINIEISHETKKKSQMATGINAKESVLSQHMMQLQRVSRAKEAKRLEEETKKQRIHALQEACDHAESSTRRREEAFPQNIRRVRHLHNEYLNLKGNIRVFCRLRCTLPGEEEDILRLSSQSESDLTVHSGPLKNVSGTSEYSNSWDFHFDHVFGSHANQGDVFEEIGLLVQSALDGYRVAIFAYGQTGSGKTYTMEGPAPDLRTPETAGIIPRTINLIFEEVQELGKSGWSFALSAGFLEVYNETVLDLLAGRQTSREPTTTPRSARSEESDGGRRIRVQSAAALHSLLRRANAERHTASTACNERSSRSHAVFQLWLDGHRTGESGEREEVHGLLSLVDLAGSERIERSGASGERLREAQHINRSLSALGDVVEALARRGQQGPPKAAACHIPYRNSRLTTLLKDSLGGDSKALMFANISPCLSQVGEVLSTLRFASKVHACKVGIAKRNVGEDGAAKVSRCRSFTLR